MIYAAKSTEDKHGSIGTQIEDGRQLAAREGMNVVDTFADEAKSAFSGDRGPELAAALATCERVAKECGSCVLIVQHSDRLVEYALWAIKADVTIRSLQDPEMFSQDGDYGLLMSVVGGIRNNQDSRRKGLAVRSGMQRRHQRGLHNGGPRPYGYVWEPYSDEHGDFKRRLAIHEAEAAVIRRIFAEFVAGRSLRQIARDLIEDGITAQRGGTWHQGTITNYLSNPLYRGAVRLNGEVYENGQHDAIVSPDSWEQARQLREAMARSPGGARGRYPKGPHLFIKGQLRCGLCGDAMIPVTKPTRTPTRNYEAYACYGRMRRGTDYCQQKPVRRELIDVPVWQFFERVALDVDSTRATVMEVQNAKLSEIEALSLDPPISAGESSAAEI